MEKSKPIKISSSQASVLQYMRSGWELGHSLGYKSRIWLQKNGIGKGGESINVPAKSFGKILAYNLIELKEKRYPTHIYQLTELGKTIKL